MPELIDGQGYELVFFEEFEIPNCTFSGEDPYWEAVDLWYGAMDDLEWYGPGQVTTKDGKLSILTENVAWVAVSEWDIVVSGILRLV
jgi:beta-glucan synthesis-associated protein KRE6